MAIITKNEQSLPWLVPEHADWQKVSELLRMAQYELVAELLDEAHLASQQRDNVLFSTMLAALRQICLACGQCRSGAEWHRQAYEEAGRREQELKQLLAILFTLAGDTDILEMAEKRLPPAVGLNRSGGDLGHLWRRIQKLLGWESTLVAPQPESPVQWVEPPGLQTVPPPPVKVEPQQAESSSAPALYIYCLGTFRVYHHEKLIEKWPGQKSKAIFKYMLIHRERPLHREVLMELFWPEIEPEAARRNLHQAMYLLRQPLQAEWPGFQCIISEDSCYRFNPELALWIDSETFNQHYEAGQRLERQERKQEAIKEYETAENLYEGEFLAEDIYEDWTLGYRENLKHAYLDTLDRLSQYYCAQEQVVLGIAYCQKILRVDNCREDAHCRLMRCYLRQGRRHLALRQYHLCVEALSRELDVPPMPATSELYQQIQKNLL